MKNYLAAFSLVATFAASASALPSMPDGFRRILSDDSGKTWRETGEFALAPDVALAALRKSMGAQGYVERFDIGGENWNSEHVLLWVKGDEEIIVSIWKKDDKLTGCSWGLSVKTPPAARGTTSRTNKVEQVKEDKKNE